MKKEIEAYFTVYLSLIVGVLLAITFTILGVVREEVIRMEIESTMDISLFSLFGEYHKELLKRYDLFAIDSTYGELGEGTEKIEEHLNYYLNENFQGKSSWKQKKLSLTGLNSTGTEIEEYCLLSDKNGQVLKEAILEYMENKKGFTVINQWKKEYERLKIIEENSYDVEGQWEKISGEINEIIGEKEKMSEEEISLEENPADYIKEKKEEGILSLALPTDREISNTKIERKNYISNREYRKGTGILKESSSIRNPVTEKNYLQEYLIEKNGNFQKEKDDTYLKYQIEYLLYGEEEDRKNLEKTLERILLGRETINFTYLMTDQVKQAEAETLATLISIACMIPELKEPVKMVLLFAWSYAESVKDIRILLEGKKVPLIKSNDTWNTPLSQLLSFTSHLDEYKNSEEGMDYEDHLKLFLLTSEEESILMRFMDLCEMDIRFLTENTNFSIDQCMVMIKGKAHINSSFGGDYQITRSWYY